MDDTFLAPVDLDVKKTVKKSNILNELRNANASLVEYRLFCVYLAHLPMNADNNVVVFRLADYAKIAGLKWPKKRDLEEQAENIVSLTAKIDTPDGGFRVLNLISEFSLFKQDDEWMVSLECSPKVAPMIREQRGKFLRYKLYNTIFLKSYNQQRLYELLKQYERIGERTITLVDLRDFLSVAADEYPAWGDFSQKLLKRSQQAINENTDICFEFEPIRANKRGKPVVAVKFTIKKNKDFVDRLQIEQHMPDAGEVGDYDGEELYKRAPGETQNEPQMSLFGVADVAESICSKLLPKFSTGQIREIAAAVMAYYAALLPEDVMPSDSQISAYINQKIAALQKQKEKHSVPHPAGYLKTIIQNDTEKVYKDKLQDDKDVPGPGKPGWQPSLGEAEKEAIQKTLRTAGNDPEVAERAEKLKAELQK